MPDIHELRTQELQKKLSRLGEAVYTRIGDLKIEAWMTPEPLAWEERESGLHKSLTLGDSWGRLFDCAWFRFRGQIPSEGAGRHVVLLLDVNGELCLVDRAGSPILGLTNKASEYDYRLGKPGKWVYEFSQCAQADAPIEIWADAGCNDLFGNLREQGRIVDAHVAICRDDLKSLYYDFEVLLDFLQHGNPESVRYRKIMQAVKRAFACLRTLNEEEVGQAQTILAEVLQKASYDTALTISAVGHGHLDLAWLWPIRESRRKAARTFATALDLIDKYPGYVFGASQCQLFQWLKTDYPALYQRIKGAVKHGSIEAQGCTWVEADLNCSGGEALVRQILYGKRFLSDEFGLEATHLWQPDVFGFNGALPQLLKKSGIRYVATQKLSWNLFNTYPHESFIWKGIDGSEVLVHFFPEKTYNSPAAPRSALNIEREYLDGDVSSHALMVFGIGDGGGGPGEEHLERLERIRSLEGLAEIRYSSASAFFEKWAQEAEQFATWSGELYLERHQGTYTTQARSKRFNRKMELALREAEWLSTVACFYTRETYPRPELEEIWKEVLLYQFHDILPGSSIRRVYEESLARYQILLNATERLLADREQCLVQQIDSSSFKNPVLLFNSLSWQREEWLNIEGNWIQAELPAVGYAVVERESQIGNFSGLNAEARLLENNKLRAKFGSDGRLISLFDKRSGAELIRPGSAANDLSIYEDFGDAWGDMDIALGSYRSKTPGRFELSAVSATLDGPQACIRQEYRYNKSSFSIEIRLMHDSERLDFVCWLDWHETQKMLRTGFPVNIEAVEATCEIQFGAIRHPPHSNTSWDAAKDEVTAHKWIDISDATHGLALLNDCKYGHRLKENVLEIALVRSAPYPGAKVVDPEDPDYDYKQFTDLTQHEFTYALYPHTGRYEQGVVQQAYELNVPLRMIKTGIHAGKLPPRLSFFSLDNPAIVIETVKLAEKSDAVIVRLYETAGGRQQVSLACFLPFQRAEVVNLMEERLAELPVSDGSIELSFGPYEILTVQFI